MKVKLIYAGSYKEGEDFVNDFIKGKKIVDIKFNMYTVNNHGHYMFLIMYEDHHHH